MTANRADWREHLALSDSHPKPTSGQAYLNLLGPNQWPSSTLLPKFQSTMEEWLDQVSDLSNRFRSLVGEAMGIDPNHFDHFLHNHQHRLRLIRYPELLGDSSPSDEDAEIQSCGAHRDTVILTLIQQASPHSCLQVQSPSGQWTDCPPIDNTFVFVAGQSLEAMTHGVTMAPWHRVIPPRPGLGPRYSVILSSTIGLDTALSNKLIQDALERLKKDITPRFPDAKGSLEDFLCKRNGDGSEGTRLLNQLLRSHPDVAARWVRKWSPRLLQSHIDGANSFIPLSIPTTIRSLRKRFMVRPLNRNHVLLRMS